VYIDATLCMDLHWLEFECLKDYQNVACQAGAIAMLHIAHVRHVRLLNIKLIAQNLHVLTVKMSLKVPWASISA